MSRVSLAHVLVLTRMGLLPHLRPGLTRCKNFLLQVNPDLPILETSSFDYHGLDIWLAFHQNRVRQKITKPSSLA